MRPRGAQLGNNNAAKPQEQRRRKTYLRIWGQRWDLEIGEKILAYLAEHNQTQKQFLNEIVSEKINRG